MAKTANLEAAKELKPVTLAEQFYERLLKGELMTVADWAMTFFDHDTLEYQHKVRSWMRGLRKRGIMAFPVSVDGTGNPRKVKIVNRDLTHFVEAYNRHAKNHAEPVLTSNFRYAEALIREHPKVREQILAKAENLVNIVADANKNLLGLPYGKSDRLLGDSKAAPGRKPTP